MIKRYSFGSVFETEAILEKPEICSEELPYFKLDMDKNSFSYNMGEDDIVYGLGENVRGINKRGWHYVSCNSDDPNHDEGKVSLYGAHNFILVDGVDRFGMFIDYPGVINFDIGYTRYSKMVITLAELNADVYIIEGKDCKDIIKQFRKLIGRSYIPPVWAFGYGQSRWGYINQDDIKNVVKGYKELNIPLDMVYMDIDYMENYKDFTVNEERFPEFKKFNSEMKNTGIHLVPIIDAGVKKEEGYDVYEEGMKNNFFMTDENGEPLAAAVWPGLSMFPDVINKEARNWFGEKYKFLLDQGVEGFWNDMNEPSIFYTEKRLDETIDKIASLKGKNLGIQEFFGMTGLMGALSQNRDDYKYYYHNVNGERVCHEKVHNLFGYNMTRAAGEAFERLVPDKRILMFSRSSYTGMHRYGGIWQGDNKSWWSHLLMNLKMMPSLNMMGLLYTGADICGFNDNTTEDLALRWMALGIFTPLMRNHSALGTREQEVYRFENSDGFRNIINLRYRLIPYLYSEYMKAVLRDEMMFKPLAFDYPLDERAKRVEDQLLLGNELMIAPIYEQNARGRMVYLPENMKMLKVKADGQIEETILNAGDHYFTCALEEVVFFLRHGAMIPLANAAKNVSELDFDNLSIISYEGKQYEYYHDDGLSKDYNNPQNIRILK